MPENSYQPREDGNSEALANLQVSAVLGGQNLGPTDGVVLGGLEGVTRRLGVGNSGVVVPEVEQRVAAIKDALKYGQKGLGLVIQALQDESEVVQRVAYLLLREKTKPEVRQALREFDFYSGDVLHTLEGHSYSVSCFTFSPDGRILASAGSYDKTIKFWNVHTGKELHTLVGHENSVSCLAFSWDGQSLVSGSQDKTMKVWGVE